MAKERKVCVHFEKAVDLVKVSSKIESAECTRCEDCREGAIDRRGGKGKAKHGKKKSASDSKAESKATWVCLQCGHFACGGGGLPTSPQCHAVRHARQSRHPLVFQVENPHLRWCFSCSTLIPVDKLEDIGEQKDVLADIVKLLKRQSSKGSSLDVEDIWFGSGSVVSELNAENKEVNVVVNEKDFYAVRGLVNLGNTCFFNSVMQNLLAMDILREYLLKYDGYPGPLTSSLKNIFLETSLDTGTRNVINPRSLFGCVCTKAPQFRGYQQQDSHELLRCLLDGLSTEDSCAQKSNNSSSENRGSEPVSCTFVDSIFGGRLSSTVCCVECGHSSVVDEPFLDLSLPVPTKKPPPKKAQPVSRTRKTKPPPKRAPKSRTKLNKDGDSVPVLSGCNPSTSNEASSGIKEASLGCPSSAELVEPSNMVDINGTVPQHSNTSTERANTSIQVPQSGVQEADSLGWLDYLEPESQIVPQECNGMAWLDYLETHVLSEDQTLAADNEDLPVSQDSGSKDGDFGTVQDTAKSSVEASLHHGNLSIINSESKVDDFGDECPVQVQDNQILLLPYIEDSATAVEGINLHAQISSSAVAGGEDSLGFDGLGDLFNEPELDVPTSSVANNFQASEHLGNGSIAGNVSESDPDEVDNTDSPVSVESCLMHFIKPELLSGEHAWHCGNCSKLLLEERRKMRKLKTASVAQRSLYNDECSSSEVLQVRNPPSPDCSTTVMASYHTNGSSDPDESSKKLDKMQINGLYPISAPEKEESSKPQNTCSLAAGASACSRPSDESSLVGSSIDSQGVLANHVPSKRLFPLGEEHESEDDEEEVDSKSARVMRDATKRILIDKAPPILTIHLKRFGQDARGRLSKLNGFVCFKEYLDLGPYLDHRSPKKDDQMYRLVGVVEHSGSMRGGHYIAYVRGGDRRHRGRRSEDENRRTTHSVWFYASDTLVRETTLEEVLRCEAYLLFYEKLNP